MSKPNNPVAANDNDDGVGALDMAIQYDNNDSNKNRSNDDDDSPTPTVKMESNSNSRIDSTITITNANASAISTRTSHHKSNGNDDDSNDSDDSSYNYQNSCYQKRYPLYHLKPFFDVGTSVYAPWWDDRVQKEYCDTFYPGTISSYKEIASSSPYGPTVHCVSTQSCMKMGIT